MNMEHLKFGFIGLGLIGGSIAKALRAKLPSCEIIVFDVDSQAMLMAMDEQVANICCSKIDGTFSQCDLIFLCAPVSCNDENLQTLLPVLSGETILTDVGSVKGDIHRHVQELGLEKQFIGGHPMAGSERIGYANAKEKLLENAYYILTPTKDVPTEKVQLMQELVTAISAIPLVLSAQDHDYATGGISHLPHVIAASLVNLIREKDDKNGIMKAIAAGGFKDITRIASSSPVMWEHICMTNSDNILQLLDSYMESLQEIRADIVSHNSEKIHDFFKEARDYRDSFNNASRGPIKAAFVISVDIPDEPGALATIVSMLAFQQINIKNIGITHNREVEVGSLQIELYMEQDIEKANRLLTDKGYTTHCKN